jgi:hypothetical protein
VQNHSFTVTQPSSVRQQQGAHQNAALTGMQRGSAARVLGRHHFPTVVQQLKAAKVAQRWEQRR